MVQNRNRRNSITPAMPAPQRPPVKQPPVGIEASIADAAATAEAARKAVGTLEGKLSERITELESSLQNAWGRVATLNKEVTDLYMAAQDAWMSCFWMYADVVVPVIALFSSPPPQKVYSAQALKGDVLLLVGAMVSTVEGTAIRTRSVAANGQITDYWVLLSNAEAKPFLSNFRLTP